MLYGANGYTGALIAREAVARGWRPILAGRDARAVGELAEELGLEHRAFRLDAPDAVARELEGVGLVCLAAGPFSSTSAPMVQACLARGTHYVDITGEIGVFEAVHARAREAEARGCVLLPGVGFDVVPSDCLAASLHEALPGATRLELAFRSSGGLSRGTAKTMVEGLPYGGAARIGGRITPVPSAWRTRVIPFRDRARSAVSIPWGDVSTAFYSTGIPEITVYMAQSPRVTAAMRLTRPLAPILGLGPVQRALKAAVDRWVVAPTVAQREAGFSQFWGEVTDAQGRRVEGTLSTPEGYRLTVQTTLECVRRILAGEVKPGAWTPSRAFGAGFIRQFEGCELRVASAAREPLCGGDPPRPG